MRTNRLEYAGPQANARPMAREPIVVAILVAIGLAVAWASRPSSNRSGPGNQSQTKTVIRMLDGAVVMFNEDVGRYPTDAEGLQSLKTCPLGVSNWKGPYVKADLIDGWGMPFVYRSTPDTPKIISAGRDRQIDTADDLHN